jgi:outer membrane protein TolC
VPARDRHGGARARKPDARRRDSAGLSKNHSIRLEREAIAAATARLSGAAGEYDPKLRFDFSGRYRRDPVTSLFSGAPAGDVAPSQSTFDSNVSVTQLFKTGASASLSTGVSPNCRRV